MFPLLSILIACAVFSVSAAPDIWFIHDLAKINPQSGAAYEAGDLYLTALPKDYKEKNSVWNAGKKTVSLKGLRDEVVAFQIIVHSDKPLKVEKVSISDFKGPSVIPSKRNVELFREWFMNVTEPSRVAGRGIFSFGQGWYPQQLIPADDPDLKKAFAWPAALPCPMNKIDSQTALVFWADVYIPDTARAGLYKADVVVTVDGKAMTYPLELKVGRERLPPVNHSNFLGFTRGIRYYYVNIPEPVKEINYLFHSHRMDFDTYNYYPETEGRGKDLKVIWDRQVRNDTNDAKGSVNFVRDILPYLKAETFTEKNGYYGPAKNTAPSSITLPLQTGWFTRKDIKYGTPEYWESFKAAAKQVHDKFKEWGLKQKKLVFINRADEPENMEGLNIGRDHADALEACRREFGLDCQYRIDLGGISQWSMRHFNEAWTPDSLLAYFKGRVQVWNLNPGMHAYAMNKETFPDFAKRHAEAQFWIYQSNTSSEPGIGNVMMDCENIGIVNWLWVMYKYRVPGGMFWEGLGGREPDTMWLNPLPFGKKDFATSNGDASYLYDGSFVMAKGGMVPSVRLKLIRRGSQDFEYFHLLNQMRGSTGASDSLVNGVISKALWEAEHEFSKEEWKLHKDGKLHPDDPKFHYIQGQWSHNPEDWVKARYAVFDLLEKK